MITKETTVTMDLGSYNTRSSKTIYKIFGLTFYTATLESK